MDLLGAPGDETGALQDKGRMGAIGNETLGAGVGVGLDGNAGVELK